mgnify:CR=1 FL=1
MTNHNPPADQLGFDSLLAKADDENRARTFERETGHLPDSYDEAIPFYRQLIDRNHAAMMAADVDEVLRLHGEAHKLALRLNGGEPGILAHEDAPGYVLEREIAAPTGTVPLWGQTGEFVITMDAMRVRVELDGMFGIGACHSFWPGFSAHAVDFDCPFLSQTGYRSFLGIHAEPVPDLTPDEFARKVIAAYVTRDLNGKPVAIEQRYRERAAS